MIHVDLGQAYVGCPNFDNPLNKALRALFGDLTFRGGIVFSATAKLMGRPVRHSFAMTSPDQRINPPPPQWSNSAATPALRVPRPISWKLSVERVRILIELGRLDGLSASESEASPPLREARAREIRELEAMVELTPP